MLSNSISEMVMFQRSVLFLQISCFITHVVFADMLFFSMQVVFKFHLLICCPQYIYLVIHIYLGYSWKVIILLTLVTIQNQPPRGFLRKSCTENMQVIYRRTPIPKCDFNKVTKQLYWNHTSTQVYSCKFGAYFLSTIS